MTSFLRCQGSPAQIMSLQLRRRGLNSPLFEYYSAAPFFMRFLFVYTPIGTLYATITPKVFLRNYRFGFRNGPIGEKVFYNLT
jgi:hypothetical protein